MLHMIKRLPTSTSGGNNRDKTQKIFQQKRRKTMNNAKNIIEKEFSTVGLIERSESLSGITYSIDFNLDNSANLVQLGEIDTSPEQHTCVEPFFDEHKLLKIHNAFEKHKEHDVMGEPYVPLLIFANVTGKYIFNLNNRYGNRIELENISIIDSPSVSIHHSKSYTGIVTSFERQEDLIVVTLDTTDTIFKCPIENFKAIDISKPINISVDDYMEPLAPYSSQTLNGCTVTEIKQL